MAEQLTAANGSYSQLVIQLTDCTFNVFVWHITSKGNNKGPMKVQFVRQLIVGYSMSWEPDSPINYITNWTIKK